MKVRTYFGILMAISIVVLGGCKNGKDTATTTDSKSNTAEEPTETIATTPQVIIDPAFTPPKDNDSFTFQSISLTDSILTMVINYSGGCEEHNFELISNGMYAKSLPPQLNMFLKHDGNNDACRMLIIDTLVYDVSPTKYGSGQEVILRLNNTKETLRYHYN